MVQTVSQQDLEAQIQQIDHLTEHFYLFKGFDAEHFPNVDALRELFFGEGHLVDHTFVQTMEYTLSSFMQALMKQIEAGNADYFVQQEIADRTQVFGTMAHRMSVYEFSTTKNAGLKWKRGISILQFILKEGQWLISSIIWRDESKEYQIPEDYLT
ncbi:MAG: hypothetical protein RI924_1007 [Bacteroidota bacterium]|jgi:hypothetical protein